MAGLSPPSLPQRAHRGAPSLFSSIPLLLLLAATAVAQIANGRLANCSAFGTDGPGASQYAYYRFYDFRNVTESQWDDIKDPKNPENTTAGASTLDMDWQLDWAYRTGLRYPGPAAKNKLLPIDYQPDSVKIKNVDDADQDAVTTLGFTAAREKEDRVLSGGIDFTDNYILHGSFRLYAKISGASGACAAFFTYANDTQEADIEVLTGDPKDIVGFNVQPTLDIHDKYVPDAHWNLTMPNGSTWDTWVKYRMDWTADRIDWYVNDVHLANTSVNVPVEPSRFSLALWGNGGTWTGDMPLGESALLEVQWIEMVYNLSGAVPLPSEAMNLKVCKLDEDEEGNTTNGTAWQPYSFPPARDSGGASGGLPMGVFTFALLVLAVTL